MTGLCCHLRQLHECPDRCLAECPEAGALTGSAVYGYGQDEPVIYWQMMGDTIWAGTATNMSEAGE